MGEVVYRQCVGCGYCCLKIPCFGALFHGWVDEKMRCTKLIWDEEANRYWCQRAKENRLFAENIYVGQGCSSDLNTWRKDVKYRG